MDNLIIVALFTFFTNVAFKLIEKIWERRKDKTQIQNIDSETDKNKSEKRKLDADSFDILNNTITELTNNYVEINKKYVEMTESFSSYRTETNKKFSEMQLELDAVKLQNLKYEVERRKLLHGIGQLIEQIKKVPQVPVWQPEEH